MLDDLKSDINFYTKMSTVYSRAEASAKRGGGAGMSSDGEAK